MKTELDQLEISTLTKSDLQGRLAKVQKDILAEQKKAQKAESKTALDTVKNYFETNKDSNVFVGRLPISNNPKAIGEVMNHYKNKAKDKTVYLFASGADQVAFGLYIGTAHIDKIKADEWANTVSEVIDGNSGGKDPSTRTGQGKKVEKVDDAIELATKWFEEKLKL